MSRSTRLLDLIQLLRTYRRPVSGSALAQRMGISIRTLYRDIATLQAQGADIQGAPGFGYVLKPGFLMPPMMLSEEEIEALVLGARWVAARADDELKDAAQNALAKIAAVLPADLRHELETNSLLVLQHPRAEDRHHRFPRHSRSHPAGHEDRHRLCRRQRPADHGGASGPLPWPISRKPACWPPGANCAMISAISAPTVSAR